MRALLVALALLAVGAPAAHAHARLTGTSPERGATVREQPRRVSFAFNEPVEASFGAVRVFDARARRVDAGGVVRPGGAGARVGVGLRPGLAAGTYTATYRLVSADGHPVSGGFVFSIGHPGAPPVRSVTDLAGPAGSGPVTRGAFVAVKALGYLAVALALGGVVFLAAVWRRALGATAGGSGVWTVAAAAVSARSRTLLAGAVALGIATSLLALVLQGATAVGSSAWSAIDAAVLRDLLHTRTGTALAVRLGAWVALGAALAALWARAPAPVLRRVALGAEGTALVPASLAGMLVLALPAAALASTPALGGHAATQSPRGLLVALDVAHVLAMSAWLGGIAFLLAALPAATRRLEPRDRSRLLAATLVRFSTLALAAVATLLVTGVVQAYVHIGAFGALTSTGYGRAVLVKAGLLLALISLGAVNRRRVVPALRQLARSAGAPGHAGRLLRRTLRAEVALLLGVLAVTGILTGTSPPSATAGGPVTLSRPLGPLSVELVVDPAQPGANELHLYLVRARDGTPFAGAREVTVRASLPAKGIGPLEVTVRGAGPGHLVADGLVLSPGGTWRLEVTARVSEFDEYQTAVEVPLR